MTLDRWRGMIMLLDTNYCLCGPDWEELVANIPDDIWVLPECCLFIKLFGWLETGRRRRSDRYSSASSYLILRNGLGKQMWLFRSGWANQNLSFKSSVLKDLKIVAASWLLSVCLPCRGFWGGVERREYILLDCSFRRTSAIKTTQLFTILSWASVASPLPSVNIDDLFVSG